MAERVTGAAQRRRGRQLRAFHRHEAMSVKLALAAALPPQRAAGGGAEGGGGVRDVRWPTGTDDSSIGDAASQPGGAAGRTRTGAAAHLGAGCRLRAGGPAARCSCAADGGQVGGCAEDRRPLRHRAGDRSAQDLKPFLSSSSSCSSCAADGGTAGGSASALCPRGHDHGTFRGHCRPHVVLALRARWEARGIWRVHSTSSGPARRGSPPAQGGI